MDQPSVLQSRSPKQAKSKKKPIKVVYISSPMKVRSTVSNFRALVQSLTGHSSDPADIEKFFPMDGGDDHGLYRVPDLAADQATDDEPSPVRLVHERDSSVSTGSSSSSSDLVDDVFTQEMLENFTGLDHWRSPQMMSLAHWPLI